MALLTNTTPQYEEAVKNGFINTNPRYTGGNLTQQNQVPAGGTVPVKSWQDYQKEIQAANAAKKTSSSSGGSGSSSSSSTSSAPVKATKVNWQGRNVDEVAAEIGFDNYTYADILDLYNSATDAKFDEIDTQTKRVQADNLRTLEDQYSLYLNTIRNDRANAVSSGITKGTAAANQLATMFTNADTISTNQEAMDDVLYDLNLARGTELQTNKITAQQERDAFQEYMASLLSTYEANSVNELAAKLAADAQTKSAQIAANATTSAAQIGANSAANSANAVNQWYLDQFIYDAGGDVAKGTANYLEYQKNLSASLLQ